MSPVLIALCVFVCLFGGALLAIAVRRKMPEHHLSGDTKTTVTTSMGLVATMAALVLGLLVASAKGSYDSSKTEMMAMQAKIAFLDRLLTLYGPAAADVRTALHGAVQQFVVRLWPEHGGQGPMMAPDTHSGERAYYAIHQLSPKNDMETELRSQALACAAELGQMRWALYEQSGTSISTPMLIVLVCWLSMLFFSFGLFAPANWTAMVALCVAAISVAGAILLIMELDQPFGGLIAISPQPMLELLAHLAK